MHFSFNNHASKFYSLSSKNKFKKCVRNFYSSQWAFENSLNRWQYYIFIWNTSEAQTPSYQENRNENSICSLDLWLFDHNIIRSFTTFWDRYILVPHDTMYGELWQSCKFLISGFWRIYTFWGLENPKNTKLAWCPDVR